MLTAAMVLLMGQPLQLGVNLPRRLELAQCRDVREILSALVTDTRQRWGHSKKTKLILTRGETGLSPEVIKRSALSASPRSFWQKWTESPTGAKPTRELIDAWTAGSSQSGLDCIAGAKIDHVPIVPESKAELENDKLLKVGGGSVNSIAVAQAKRPRLVTLRFGLPAFNHSRSEALVSYVLTCGLVCGHGGLVLVSNAEGHWSEIGYRSLVEF